VLRAPSTENASNRLFIDRDGDSCDNRPPVTTTCPRHRVDHVEAVLDATDHRVDRIGAHCRDHTVRDRPDRTGHRTRDVDGDVHGPRSTPMGELPFEQRVVGDVGGEREVADHDRRRLRCRPRRTLRLVDEPTQQRHTVQPVGEAVMSAQEDRGAPAFEALDDRDVPGRQVAVERSELEQRDEIEHLAQIAGRRHGHHADVLA
jgi:hypothetical protein